MAIIIFKERKWKMELTSTLFKRPLALYILEFELTNEKP